MSYMSLIKEPEHWARFMAKVDQREDNECWPWLASTTQDFYGLFHLGGGMRRATRLMAYAHGMDPTGVLVMHTCDNPPCVNPRHFKLGTDMDNATDSVVKGRKLRGSENPVSKVTEQQVLEVHNLLTQGKSSKEISELTDIPQTIVQSISKGSAWGWLTGRGKNYGV